MELNRLTVAVHFVPLPAQESEERTQCLRTLLLRGALRAARETHENDVEVLPSGIVEG
jgi:hypothetical protein